MKRTETVLKRNLKVEGILKINQGSSSYNVYVNSLDNSPSKCSFSLGSLFKTKQPIPTAGCSANRESSHWYQIEFSFFILHPLCLVLAAETDGRGSITLKSPISFPHANSSVFKHRSAFCNIACNKSRGSGIVKASFSVCLLPRVLLDTQSARLCLYLPSNTGKHKEVIMGY